MGKTEVAAGKEVQEVPPRNKQKGHVTCYAWESDLFSP